MRRYDDPVEVRRGEHPEQFVWRGKLWHVREVVAHWVETGAWWSRPDSSSDLLAEQEIWRVAAANPSPGFGVFDLSFSWTDGQWRLVGAVD